MSNLPPLNFKPVCEYIYAIEIDAPVEAVWKVLMDLESYPLWNPYIRLASAVDANTHKPTEDRAPRANACLQVAMQMPPGLQSSSKPHLAHETLSVVDPAAYQFVWGGGRMPSVFRGHTAQALSTTADGKTRYEIRKALGGASAYLMRRLMGQTLQDCCQALAEALKQRVEAQSS